MIEGAKNETVFQNAIKHWWESKNVNAAGISKSQGGTRDQNLRGDTMDGFRTAIIEQLLAIGIRSEDIFFDNQIKPIPSNLPSYYRASKNWDILVCKNSHFKRLRDPSLGPPTLLAAVEFKSQDKSIGNNQNNRMEESIGNAYDFWSSYENSNFIHLTPRPWLGYLFVGRYGENDDKRTVEIKQPHFPSDEAFGGADPDSRLKTIKIAGPSYAERYKIFLERMIAKKLYDGACFLVTDETVAKMVPNYRILYPGLSGEKFLDGLRRHVGAYYFD